jgi:hypothetical protein
MYRAAENKRKQVSGNHKVATRVLAAASEVTLKVKSFLWRTQQELTARLWICRQRDHPYDSARRGESRIL